MKTSIRKTILFSLSGLGMILGLSHCSKPATSDNATPQAFTTSDWVNTCSSDDTIPSDTIQAWQQKWKNKTSDLKVTDHQSIKAQPLQEFLSSNDPEAINPSIRIYLGLPQVPEHSGDSAIFCVIVAMLDSNCNDVLIGSQPYMMFSTMSGTESMLAQDQASQYVDNFQNYIFEQPAFENFGQVYSYNFRRDYIDSLLLDIGSMSPDSGTTKLLAVQYGVHKIDCSEVDADCEGDRVSVIDLILTQKIYDTGDGGPAHGTSIGVNFSLPCPKHCGGTHLFTN